MGLYREREPEAEHARKRVNGRAANTEFKVKIIHLKKKYTNPFSKYS